MMNINDNNYELWLLRYAEQELTAAERTEVERWLASHPEAAEELALYNEAPRLERDEAVRYVAVPRQQKPRQQTMRHTQSLWQTAWRWAAAAAVVVALMLPGLRQTTSPAPPLAVAGNTPEYPEIHETQDYPEKPEKQKATHKPMPKTISLPPTPREEPSTLAVLHNPEQPETLDSLEQLETPDQPAVPTPHYVDNLIVYENEPEPETVTIEEYAAAEVVYTRTESGVNPIGLFISTFIKANK